MSLLFVLLVLVIFFSVLFFVAALRIIFTFNSDRADINLTLLWLYPFLKAVITNKDTNLVLAVYLFNKNIIKRPLAAKALKADKTKTNRMELVRQIRPRDININASYGFRDPFITGVACGAMSMASQFINIDSIHQNPDFVSDNDYIYLDATAKINLGSTLINLYRVRSEKPVQKNANN